MKESIKIFTEYILDLQVFQEKTEKNCDDMKERALDFIEKSKIEEDTSISPKSTVECSDVMVTVFKGKG